MKPPYDQQPACPFHGITPAQLAHDQTLGYLSVWSHVWALATYRDHAMQPPQITPAEIAQLTDDPRVRLLLQNQLERGVTLASASFIYDEQVRAVFAPVIKQFRSIRYHRAQAEHYESVILRHLTAMPPGSNHALHDWVKKLGMALVSRALGVEMSVWDIQDTLQEAVHFLLQVPLHRRYPACRAFLKATSYLHEHVIEPKRYADDGLVAQLANVAQANAIHGHRFTVNLVPIVIGSTMLTSMLAPFLKIVFAYPEQLAFLRAQPDKLPQLVEEALRLIAYTPQIRYDANLDQTIRMYVAEINRDPAVFENPQTFDPNRPTNPHLTFGYGEHYCIGAALTRVVMASLLKSLVFEVDNFQLISDETPHFIYDGITNA